MSARIATAVNRRTPGFLRRVVRRYAQTNSASYATSISWNALFSLVPIILLLVTLLGLALQNRGFAVAVEARIARLGDTINDRNDIRSALAAFRDHTGLLALIGAVTLLWSGSGLFSAMDNALSPLYGERARPWVRKKLMSFGMTLLFTALIVPLMLSAVLLSEGTRFSVLPRDLPVWLVSMIQFAAGALDGTLIYAAIYYVIPHRKQRLRHVLPGAVFSGAALELVTLLFPLYFELTDSFKTYGILFAVIVLLVTYFYLVGQITMLGGLLNVELDPAAAGAEAVPR
ncbi:MAG: YihY/virulence factor BrkB family protein [Candidatus Dormibacteria bacterium]